MMVPTVAGKRLMDALALYGERKCTYYRLAGSHDWSRAGKGYACDTCHLRVGYEKVLGRKGLFLRTFLQYPGGLSAFNPHFPHNLWQGGDDPELRFCLRCGSDMQAFMKNMQGCMRRECPKAACFPSGHCCVHDPRKRRASRHAGQASIIDWIEKNYPEMQASTLESPEGRKES